MKSIVIIGAGQFGKAIQHLFNLNKIKLLCFGDNNEKIWNTTINNIPVYSIEKAISFHPDYCFISVSGNDRIEMLKKQIADIGYNGKYVLLKELMEMYDIRSAVLYNISKRIKDLNIQGDIAELGVYKGDLAWQINMLFPDHKLYLFDTFEGFDERDVAIEKENHYSKGNVGDFSDTSVFRVLKRCPYPHNIILKKGYFPTTAIDLDNHLWSFVSLDTDLYQSIYEGILYFYPRLSHGGMILLHDYNNKQFIGAHKAVDDYEKKYGALLLVPLCDLHGSAVIIKV